MLLPRRKTFHVNSQPRQFVEPRRAPGQGLLLDGYAPSQMIEDLRKYQSELEIQNRALRYSQQEAEGASERFATLFSSVPLALMVVDEEGQVMASNAMAQRLFQPLETDAPLHFLLPFVATSHADEVAVAFLNARNGGTSEVSEVVFIAGSAGNFTGDLHIARIDNPQGDLAHFICAVIDQGPLLTQRHALQESAASLCGLRGFGLPVRQQDLVVAIRSVVHDPERETLEFLRRDVLNLAMRNTDNHARNTAVQRTADGRVQLTPVFDFSPMFMDPELVARSCHWQSAAGQRLPDWQAVVDDLPVDDAERERIAAALVAFAPVVERLPQLAMDAGVDGEVIEQCCKSIDRQAQQLWALARRGEAHRHG